LHSIVSYWEGLPLSTPYTSLEEFLKTEGAVILLDKPLGWTSFDATNKVRIHLKYQYGIPKIKVGHAGTLDPLATGLLLLCVGKTTKQIAQLQDMTKTYTGTITLGATTPSFDAETEVSMEMPTAHITHQMIYDTALAMTGSQMQEPPLFSAIKLNGKRAYLMARKEEEVTLASRPVVIYAFKITGINDVHVQFEVTCSKGTYIRALARDFGKALNSCGYLTALRRTKIGDYDVKNALIVEKIDQAFTPYLPES
jgi:tRNA pseudouridine55 synthase